MEATADVQEVDAPSGGNVDEESLRGRFGWIQIAGVDVPYIIRCGQPYLSVRMVKGTILITLDNYLKRLNKKVYEIVQTQVESFYVTEAEMHLLNEINAQHCDYVYGPASIIRANDVLVKADDISEFHKYVMYCYNRLSNYPGEECDAFCGFIKINTEFVPYTSEATEKVVPLFYFEVGPTNIMQHAHPLKGWPLVYLKFLLTVQGIRKEFFSEESMLVVNLSVIKDLFPRGTVFEYSWPAVNSPAHLKKPSASEDGLYAFTWMKKPEGLPWNNSPPGIRHAENQNGIQGRANSGSYPFRNYQPHNAVSISTKTGNQMPTNQLNCNQSNHHQRSRRNRLPATVGPESSSTASNNDTGSESPQNSHVEAEANAGSEGNTSTADTAPSLPVNARHTRRCNVYRGSYSATRSVSMRRQLELTSSS